MQGLGLDGVNCMHLSPLTSLFFRLFLRINCFEMQSRCKTQENDILLDVCVTKSMCWGYVLYMMWPVTVFKQRFHMIRNI